jgi:uncharacterized membrane protein
LLGTPQTPEGGFSKTSSAMKKDPKKPRKKKSKKDLQLDAETKQKFYKHLGYLVLSLLGLFLFKNAKPPGSYVALLFFLSAFFLLRIIILNSNLILDSFFRPKNFQEESPKSFDTFMFHFANAFFVTSIAALIFQIRQLAFTLNGSSFFWKSGGIGLLIALFVTMLLLKFRPSVYFNSKRRFAVHGGLFLGFFLITPAIASYINLAYAHEEANCKNELVLQKKESKDRKRNRMDYYIYLKINGTEEERFEIKKALYSKIEVGDSVQFCSQIGKLGYEYVTEITTKQSW